MCVVKKTPQRDRLVYALARRKAWNTNAELSKPCSFLPEGYSEHPQPGGPAAGMAVAPALALLPGAVATPAGSPSGKNSVVSEANER